MADTNVVVLAGGTGDLGGRIARELVARGANVRALVRPEADPGKVATLEMLGVEPVRLLFEEAPRLREACSGASCVVSALSGLEDVMLGAQGQLLDAAVAAGVPRFIPSDFALDFTKTTPGRNRNLDLRRRFMARIDRAPIRATSILNGAFAELLLGQAPFIQARIHRVLHWGSADQIYDFTAKDDVARYTSFAALDDDAPRILRIAGDQASPRMLAAIMTDLTGSRFRTLRAGGTKQLSALIAVAKTMDRKKKEVFPAWQGMQYTRDMAEGKGALLALDVDRYGPLPWIRVRELLAPKSQRVSTDSRMRWSSGTSSAE